LNSLKKHHKKKQSYSQKAGESLADFDVFIIDTIGILTKIYSYADIALWVVVLESWQLTRTRYFGVP
jgi:3-deoxy-D-manno-octulosonic-acid transferase